MRGAGKEDDDNNKKGEEEAATTPLEDVQNTNSPFSKTGARENFPDLGEALLLSDSRNSESSNIHNSSFDQHSNSFGSHSSSAMNLSIGARAALNEHLRHVATYGLDTSSHHSGDGLRASVGDGALGSPPLSRFRRNSLDERWDRLLDEGQGAQNSSTEGSASVERAMEEQQGSFDVASTSTTDFFNSSRVGLLGTPEKNRSRKGTVTKRGDGIGTGSCVYDSSTSASLAGAMALPFFVGNNTSDGSRSPQSHVGGRTGHQTETSFASLPLSAVDTSSRIGALDMSHISADDSLGTNTGSVAGLMAMFPPRRSPDSSFSANHQHYPHNSNFFTIDEEMQNLFSKKVHLNDTGLELYSTGGATPSISASRQSSRIRRRRQENPNNERNFDSPQKPSSPGKENERITFGGLNIDTLAMSPISSSARGEPSSPPFPATGNRRSACATSEAYSESFFRNRLQSLDDADSAGRLTEVLCDATHDSDISTIQNQSSSAKNTSSSSGGTTSKSPSAPGLSPEHADRRRYRTVVPARVFMDDPDEFPEQHDSFYSAPLPRTTPLCNSGPNQSWRSAPV